MTRDAQPAPAMSPSDLPVEVALDRARGPRRGETVELLDLFGEVTGEQPVVWAGRIIGYGAYEYRYDSGRTGRAPELAFASGAREHTLYLVNDAEKKWPEVFARLGKYRASKACVYLSRLSEVDHDALRELLELSLAETRNPHST